VTAGVVAALALVIAVQAGAGRHGTALPKSAEASMSVEYVSGYQIRGKTHGTLEGAWVWTGRNGGLDAFLKTLEYDAANGVMRFRVPESIRGSIAGGGKGTLVMSASTVQMFKPGTPLYDFSTYPSAQPGTTGDPKQWLGGWGVHRITGGTGVFRRASGVINHRDIRVLTDANYWGMVRLNAAG
jgi:hypothetical protein